MDQYHHTNQYVSTVMTKASNYLLALQEPVHYNCKQNAATTKPLQQQLKRNGRPIVAIEIAAEVKMKYCSVAGVMATRRNQNIQCLLHIPMARGEQVLKVPRDHSGKTHLLQAGRKLFDKRMLLMSASEKL